MGPLKNYDTVVNGKTTTLRLSDRDAKIRGLTEAATTPRNKARTRTRNKGKKREEPQKPFADVTDQDVALTSLTVPELEEYAASHEVDVTGLKLKQELLDAIAESADGDDSTED